MPADKRYKLSWGVDDTCEGVRYFATESEAIIYAFNDLSLSGDDVNVLDEQGQCTQEVAGSTEWTRLTKEEPFTFMQGAVNSRVDTWFAKSSPVWTGITARILRGFQGVHPNA